MDNGNNQQIYQRNIKEELETEPKIRKEFSKEELLELNKEIEPYRVEYFCPFRKIKARGFGLEEEKKFLREIGRAHV